MTQPSSEYAKALIGRYLDAFAQGDVQATLDCIHPQAIWHVDGDPEVVTVGLLQGHAAIATWLVRFAEGFQAQTFSIHRLLAEGPDVVAMGRFRHRVLPGTSLVDSDFAIRFTLRDGLIGRYQIFEDSLMIAQARATGSPARQGRVDGVRLGWNDVGNGSPVLFLHGLFLDRHAWNPVIEACSAHHRCVAFDMPGHGVSQWRAGLTLGGIAHLFALWAQENDAAPMTLVGHSQGGMVALRLAAAFPQSVSRVIVVNTSARAEPAERLPIWRRRHERLLTGAAEEVFDDVQAFAGRPAPGLWQSAETARQRQTLRHCVPSDIAQALEAAVLERRDMRACLSTIHCPVTVLAGGQDTATPPEWGQEIAMSVSRGTLRVVEQAGHLLPLEAPEVVVDAVLAP
jgi:pimeloyl-ACP methyl ester carboxylesterase/ketosteroid isomerase-like protein